MKKREFNETADIINRYYAIIKDQNPKYYSYSIMGVMKATLCNIAEGYITIDEAIKFFETEITKYEGGTK